MGKKNDKNGPKFDKNCAKIALFLYIFRICSLKILTSWKSRGGARAPVPHSWRRQWVEALNQDCNDSKVCCWTCVWGWSLLGAGSSAVATFTSVIAHYEMPYEMRWPGMQSLQILNNYILLGNAATHLRRGGILLAIALLQISETVCSRKGVWNLRAFDRCLEKSTRCFVLSSPVQ